MPSAVSTPRGYAVTVHWHGSVRETRFVAAGKTFSVGEAGDLALSGIGERSLLVTERGPAKPAPGGFTRSVEGGAAIYRSEHDPSIVLEIRRVQHPPKALRRGLVWNPTRELMYGFAVAGLLASLIVVPVAVSASNVEPDAEDESEISIAMHETFVAPIVYTAPPAFTVDVLPEPVASGKLGVDEPVDDGRDRKDDPADGDADETAVAAMGQVEVATSAIVELVEPTKIAERKKKLRKRKSKGARGQVRILGTVGGSTGNALGGGGSSDAGLLSVLASESGDEDAAWAYGAADVIDVEEPAVLAELFDEAQQSSGELTDKQAPANTDLPSPSKDAPRGTAKSPALELPTSKLPTKKLPTSKRREDKLNKGPGCKVRYEPNPQVDVVFVVDLSDGDATARQVVLDALPSIDAQARKHDAAPRYGLVAFIDQVWVPSKTLQGFTGFKDHASDWLSEGPPDDAFVDQESANNGVDAVYEAAKRMRWRDAADTTRVIVYVGSAPVAGREDTVSGVTVEHGWRETQTAIDDGKIRLIAFTGPNIQRTTHPLAKIASKTGGNRYGLAALRRGKLDLAKTLVEPLKNPVCDQPLFGG